MMENDIVAMTAAEIDMVDGGSAWDILNPREWYQFGKEVGNDIGDLIWG